MAKQVGPMGTKEAAHTLGIHPETALRLAKDGRLPATKVGGQWRFNRTRIERMGAGENTSNDAAAL